MRVGYFPGVTSFVTFVVIEMAACKLVHIRCKLTMLAFFCLEGIEVEPKELVPRDEVCFVVVKEVAVKSDCAGVIGAFGVFIFIHKWVIEVFEVIVAFFAFLNEVRGTSFWQEHISEG